MHWIEGYPVDRAIQLLNSWAQYSLDSFIDLLNNSDQVLTKYQVSVQWVLELFLQNKPAPVYVYLFLVSLSPPLPSPPLPWVLACTLICDMQVTKVHVWARSMHDLGL